MAVTSQERSLGAVCHHVMISRTQERFARSLVMLPSSSDSLLPAVFPVALDLVPLDLPVEDLEAAPLLPAPPVLLPGLVPHHHVTHLGAGLASLQGRQVRLRACVIHGTAGNCMVRQGLYVLSLNTIRLSFQSRYCRPSNSPGSHLAGSPRGAAPGQTCRGCLPPPRQLYSVPATT